jgi:hypothetical protein
MNKKAHPKGCAFYFYDFRLSWMGHSDEYPIKTQTRFRPSFLAL